MSWWSNKEQFDEYDPPYCAYCNGGTSYEGCKACEEEHEREKQYRIGTGGLNNGREIDSKWSNNTEGY